MPQAPARRRAQAGDKGDHGFGKMIEDKVGGLLFGASAYFADEHHRLGVGILVEGRKAIDEISADYRIAANADTGRLTQAGPAQLLDHFIGEGAGTGDDPDRAGGKDGLTAS